MYCYTTDYNIKELLTTCVLFHHNIKELLPTCVLFHHGTCPQHSESDTFSQECRTVFVYTEEMLRSCQESCRCMCYTHQWRESGPNTGTSVRCSDSPWIQVVPPPSWVALTILFINFILTPYIIFNLILIPLVHIYF